MAIDVQSDDIEPEGLGSDETALPDIDSFSEGFASSVDQPVEEQHDSESFPALPMVAADEVADDEASHHVSDQTSGAELHSEDHHLVGTNFNGYMIDALIGQGGMGQVFKARQISLDRIVAIKMLNKSLVDNEEFVRRFQREARAMAQIAHNNIVSVYDFGEFDQIHYMVVEYISGTNLASWIKKRLYVEPKDLSQVIIQCLDGLQYISQRGLVHRDIKPDNILIDHNGVAKLADFGLAKDHQKEETDLTAVGSAMGTPAYMSPEQCMGRELDIRSDIYALGITAFYALTGEKPFVGRSSFEIMTKQREHQPPLVNEINPQIPHDVACLVDQMMAKDPANRFTDADACRIAWLQVSSNHDYLALTQTSGLTWFLILKMLLFHR